MRRRTSASLVAALLPLLLALLTACSSSDGGSAAPTSTPTASVSSAAPAPAAPRVGSCHSLTLREATDPVDAGAPVGCRRPHTSVTVKVGRISALADGHLLAVDSRTVRARLTQACPREVTDLVGGDQTARRLSRLEVVWFAPTLEQADAGADWFRCDVVGIRSTGRLLPLPATVAGLLDQPGAGDRYGTCGTAAPDARGFQRVVCSVAHSWRAVDTVDLPAGTAYLDKTAGTTADSSCQDVASARADGALKFSWSFEWPTRAQWDAGQRYGYCWVPEA